MTLRLTAFILAPLLFAACASAPVTPEPDIDAKSPDTVETPPPPIDINGPDAVVPEPTPPAEMEPAPTPVIPAPAPPITQPAPQPVTEPPAPSTAVETNSTAQLVDHTSTDRIPFTNKLVRGIRNGAIITMKPGETLTLALNANRITGYAWELDGPFAVGGDVEFVADYYREGESPYPDRVSIGGARYFIVKANAPGTYGMQIRHVGATEVRATKVMTIQVETPPA
jgi:predicted secreted protein